MQVPVTEDSRRRLPWLSLVASAAFTSALSSGSSLVTRCIATLHMAVHCHAALADGLQLSIHTCHSSQGPKISSA